jgi:hypothetical protein
VQHQEIQVFKRCGHQHKREYLATESRLSERTNKAAKADEEKREQEPQMQVIVAYHSQPKNSGNTGADTGSRKPTLLLPALILFCSSSI